MKRNFGIALWLYFTLSLITTIYFKESNQFSASINFTYIFGFATTLPFFIFQLFWASKTKAQLKKHHNKLYTQLLKLAPNNNFNIGMLFNEDFPISTIKKDNTLNLISNTKTIIIVSMLSTFVLVALFFIY